MTVDLVLGVTLGFSAAVQPGPLTAYLVSQTLANGWRRTWPAIFCPLISDGPIAAIALLVLSRISPALVKWLHLLGGGFVLLLAVGAARTWLRYEQRADAPAASGRGGLLKATMVNVLNPSPWLGWSLVLGPLLLTAWRASPARGAALVGGFYATMFVTLLAIILVFHLARTIGPRVNRALIGMSAVALAGFALYQLWLGTGAWRG